MFKGEELEPLAPPVVPLVGPPSSWCGRPCSPRLHVVLPLLNEGINEGIVNVKGLLLSSRGAVVLTVLMVSKGERPNEPGTSTKFEGHVTTGPLGQESSKQGCIDSRICSKIILIIRSAKN